MTREQRRQAMPICAAFTDEMRGLFGDVTVIRAEENGLTWGEEISGETTVGPYHCTDGKGDVPGITFVRVGKA